MPVCLLDSQSGSRDCELTDVSGVKYWDTSKTKIMGGWFRLCTKLENVDLSTWDTSNVETFQDMFGGDTALTDISMTFNTSGKNSCYLWYLLTGCTNLERADLNGDFSGVGTAQAMFNQCNNLSYLNLNHVNMLAEKSSTDYKEPEALGGTDPPFGKCKSFNNMFYQCKKVGNISGLDKWCTSSATDMRQMFSQWSNAIAETSIQLDVSNFDTSNVTDFHGMFDGSNKLNSIIGLNKFDVSKGKDFGSMFYGCPLTSIDLSSFNKTDATKNCTDFSKMFMNCSKLTSIDVSGFNTTNGTSFTGMFYGCSGLTFLDISNLNTLKAKNLSDMFRDCYNLVAINIDKDVFQATSACTGLVSTFNGCTSLRACSVSF